MPEADSSHGSTINPPGHSDVQLKPLPVTSLPEDSYSTKRCRQSGPQLPTELWSEIFELALPHREEPGQFQRQVQTEVPTSLTLTCHSWRDIAIATPRIWTNIDILVTAEGPKTSLLPGMEVLKGYLKKSRNCPLNIVLQGPLEVRKGDEDWTTVELVLQTLVLELARWKTVYLHYPNINDDLLSTFLGVAAGAPLLETLMIYTIYYTRGLQSKDFPSCIPTLLWKNAPALRQFALTHEFPLEDWGPSLKTNPVGWPTTTHIPYHQLTVLQLDGSESEVVTVSEILAILRTAPNLVTCRILQIARDPGSETDSNSNTDTDTDTFKPLETSKTRESQGEIILLPNLKHLRLDVSNFDLSNYEGYSLARLLDRLTTPALLSLTLCYDEHWEQPYFSSFIRRSECQLEELYLMFSGMPGEDLVECMRVNPSLKALQFGPRFQYQDSLRNVNKVFRELLLWDFVSDQFTTCPVLEKFCMDPVYIPEKRPGKHCQMTRMERARTGVRGESFYFGPIADSYHVVYPDNMHFLGGFL